MRFAALPSLPWRLSTLVGVCPLSSGTVWTERLPSSLPPLGSAQSSCLSLSPSGRCAGCGSRLLCSNSRDLPARERSGSRALRPRERSGSRAPPPRERSGSRAFPARERSGSRALPARERSGSRGLRPLERERLDAGFVVWGDRLRSPSRSGHGLRWWRRCLSRLLSRLLFPRGLLLARSGVQLRLLLLPPFRSCSRVVFALYCRLSLCVQTGMGPRDLSRLGLRSGLWSTAACVPVAILAACASAMRRSCSVRRCVASDIDAFIFSARSRAATSAAVLAAWAVMSAVVLAAWAAMSAAILLA